MTVRSLEGTLTAIRPPVTRASGLPGLVTTPYTPQVGTALPYSGRERGQSENNCPASELFAKVWAKYEGNIHAYICAYLKRTVGGECDAYAEADDLTSEVAAKVLEAFGKGKVEPIANLGEKGYEPFLFRVAHNHVIDYLRGQDTRHPMEFTDLVVAEDFAGEAIDRVYANEFLEKYLPKLTALQQRVIQLSLMELSNKEICSMLGKTLPSVKKHKHLALENLRGFYAAEQREAGSA